MLFIKKTIQTLILLSGYFLFISVTYKKKSDFSLLEAENSYSLTVVINNVRNKDGRIQLDLYKNQSEFEARMSDKTRRVYLYKSKMVDNTLTHVYKNVAGDVYGVAILDDENKNGKMDYGWFLPSEGFGFGEYWHTKWSTPIFDNFKFTLRSDKTITVKAKYL